ncbi:sensor histidine kinase [Dactylosporangium aurantiacum]|uniref:Sensor histidine kinase n=1 Tax=Dactylosporangium aurantiacum TaxID=35754 RepID=A0A9Q9MIV1_9ACTN|nr:sensor histidine kinase [Dactylosporangium aurantiacum]MDG6106184.1 sensor histidine kinase [Dactylosporangium aurantiacum]UWZ58314.1 sensor histidine kinase [Dactylosporangium aurantiacum]
MRSGAAAAHRGYFHETGFYGSDEEFLAMVVPFFADGLAAGEPVVSAFAPANQRLVRDAFGAGCGIRFVDGEAQYLRPAGAIRGYRAMLADYVAAGATQIRVAGDVPHPGVGALWDWWARYEAAVNRAYDDYPIWGLCPYDTRITPANVLRDVRRTHPHIATAAGHDTNPTFTDPVAFLAESRAGWRDPLEAHTPDVRLADPSAAQVRAAITAVAAGTGVSGEDVGGLQLSATEAVTNAICHGAAPVDVRIWAAPDRIVVAVHDVGPGPTDPFAGLLPIDESEIGGRGLWLMHQLCAFVSLHRASDGFTVRLVAAGATAGPPAG